MTAVAGATRRWGAGRTYAQRFLERPFASLQLLAVSAAGLMIFGVMMAVSTTIAASYDSRGGSLWGQAVKEFAFVAVGLVAFVVAARWSPRVFRLLAYPALGLAVVGLVGVLVPGIGAQVNGSSRWADIGPVQVQPSEFAKLAILLWGADLLARKQEYGTLRQARHLFVPLVPGFVAVVALVMLEPDLGTTLCFVMILFGLLWTVGTPLRYFGLLLALVGGVITLLAVAEPYRLQRLTSFTHPFRDAQGTGFHTVQSIYALASGGVFGVGLGQGTAKYWVPNANSDYVFAIIGEELGLLGCLAVLLLFVLFAFAGVRIVRRNTDPFVRIAAGAATVWLCGQAIVNVGYVTALLPVTGIPLPLISAGGTSLIVTCFVFGMLTSFARHEPAAIEAARKAHRLGRRSRVERWTRTPVPAGYAAPRRRASAQRPDRPLDRPSRQDAPRRDTRVPAAGSRASTARGSVGSTRQQPQYRRGRAS